MKNDIERLWQYLGKHRGTAPTHELLWKALATEQKIKVTPDLLGQISQRFGSWLFQSYVSSPDLAAFIAEIAAIREPKSVLDPTCGSGLLLKTVADRVNASTVHGVEIDKTTATIAQRLLGEKAKVMVADVLHDTIPLNQSYDLIVSEPPFKSGPRKSLAIDGLNLEVKGNFSDILAPWVCTRISEGGMAILILPPSFLWARGSEQAKKAIADLGCAVTGCINLPGGSLQGTRIEAYVLIIERGEQGDLFVGQYTADRSHQRVLVNNFAARKEGRRPAQGRLCSWSDFRGYRSIESSERIPRLVARLGFDPIPMSKLVAKTTSRRGTDSERLQPKPNSVYLPLLGHGKAMTSQDSLPDRIKHYVQLELDPELADARLVANLFNRELGQAILDTIRKETSIGIVHISDLMSATFYLPPFKVQTKVLQALDQITNIRGELEELETTLWADTREVDQLARHVQLVNHEDTFEDWIETLPFPLATILWRYRAASGSAREKYETLLHFFEALAEFVATVHLSAFLSETEIWSQHRQRLHDALTAQHLSLEMGTFGAWKCVTEYLGARLREMTAKTPDVSAALYRTHNGQTLSMLASSKLFSILQQANSVRNDWLGHVGAISQKQAEAIHSDLFSLVQQCRGVLGRLWLDYELIQPENSRFHDGIFHYDVRRLQGTRSSPFELVERESVEGMDDRSLYLLDPNSDRGLPLLPFVRIMPSPRTESNACYFFSRLEGNDKCRYVSYHFAQDPEVLNAFADTRNALESLALGTPN